MFDFQNFSKKKINDCGWNNQND